MTYRIEIQHMDGSWNKAEKLAKFVDGAFVYPTFATKADAEAAIAATYADCLPGTVRIMAMTTARRLKYADLRTDPAYMVFWDAINEGRAKTGLPEALYANVREMWEAAMEPTRAEVTCAAERATSSWAVNPTDDREYDWTNG